MTFTADQEKEISNLIAAKDYKGIVAYIAVNTDQTDEKFTYTLDIVSKLGTSGKLAIGNIEKLSDVFTNHATAPATALAAAYDAFYEQAGGLGSITQNNVQIKVNKADELALKVANLSSKEQIATIANSLTKNEVESELIRIKAAIEPGIAVNNIDPILVKKLELFKAAFQLQTYDSNSNENATWNKVETYEEIETTKPVRVVPGMIMLEAMHDRYLQTLDTPIADNQANQWTFLNNYKLISRKTAVGKSDDLGNLPNVKEIQERDKLIKNICASLTKAEPIPAEDIMYTDDLQYSFANKQVLHQHKVDDRNSPDFYKYIFTFDDNKKQNMDFVLSVHRINDHGKLIPNSYDLVQYQDGEPIAMISNDIGNSALRDFDYIQSSVKLASYDFSLLNKKPAANTQTVPDPVAAVIAPATKDKPAKSPAVKNPATKKAAAPTKTKEKKAESKDSTREKTKKIMQKHIKTVADDTKNSNK